MTPAGRRFIPQIPILCVVFLFLFSFRNRTVAFTRH